MIGRYIFYYSIKLFIFNKNISIYEFILVSTETENILAFYCIVFMLHWKITIHLNRLQFLELI